MKGIASYLASLEKSENKKLEKLNEFFGGNG